MHNIKPGVQRMPGVIREDFQEKVSVYFKLFSIFLLLGSVLGSWGHRIEEDMVPSSRNF